GVERDRHRSFDHVLDGYDPAVGVAPFDRGDDLGHRRVRGAFTGREVVLRAQRLFGERPGRTEVCDARHHGIVGERCELTRWIRPARDCRAWTNAPDRAVACGDNDSAKEAAMRAALFVETGAPLSIENLEPAPPGPKDVVVQLGASGVCHSDLSLKNGYVGGLMPGTVLGHEGAGTVLEVGSEVGHIKKGANVVASFIPACGNCWFCLHDQSHLCDTEFEVMMAMRGTRPDGNPFMAMTGLGTFAETMTC